MKSRARSLGLTNALLGALLLTLVLNPLFAGAGQPADKVVANGNKLVVIEPDGVAPILTATFKSSAPSDLLIQVTLECSILTRVVTPGSPQGGAMSTGEAEGRIRVWAEFDGQIVPINSVSQNPQPQNPSSPGDDSDKVTFCNRHNRNTLTDMEDEPDGVDQMEVYLNTKDANAFNWVWLNTGSGPHTLVVKAQFDQPTAASPGSTASGFVGNRTLIVEPTKMANDASV